MRRSQDEAALTRQTILEAASRLFRGRGISSVSIADITSSVGLTDGGFYRHFSSKEALVNEAIDVASVETTDANQEHFRNLEGLERTTALVDEYLSENHRKHPEAGCPVAALCSEMRNASASTRAAFTTALQRLLTVVDSAIPPTSKQRRMAQLQTAASIVGAIVLARATDDEQLAGELLSAVRRGLHDAASEAHAGERLRR